MDRLTQQIEFITEIDKLKSIYRQTFLIDGSRKENDAEHSWHLAIMTMLLGEYAASDKTDILRTMKMVIIHDLVEIDAGDTYAYDAEAHNDKAEREKKAADRLFGLLPIEQCNELRELWDEFEERETPEARLAAALDMFQPLLHNYKTKGKSWQSHGVKSDRVFKRIEPIKEFAPKLWEYAIKLIEEAVQKGYLTK